MNQLQTEIIEQILKQGNFQPNQPYQIHDYFSYINQLIKNQFPIDLIDLIIKNQQNDTNEYTYQELVDMIHQEYLNQKNISQQANNQILSYQNKYKQLLEDLKVARIQEKQNEFEIDEDSKLYITINYGECIKSSSYYVVIKLFSEYLQTKITEITNQPHWNEDFQISVSSPHGQIFIGLYDQQHQLVGQLLLPLYQFKDQQHSTISYILENEHGLLINTKLKLNITIWWIHSQVALLEDQIQYVDHYKKEINEQQVILNKANYYIETLLFVFNRSRIQIKPAKVQVEEIVIVDQVQHAIQVNSEPIIHWTIQYQDAMYSIIKIFKNNHQDSIEEWQDLVMILSGIATLITLFLVILSRPCFQQLLISMSIGMLVWVYQSNPIKTTKILAQISLILLIQQIFDICWLIVNYNVWWTNDFILEQQIFGNSILNYISYFGTIIYIPFDLILAACSFNLSLKYLKNNNCEL